MSYSSVRLALEASVACTAPSVRLQTSHESTVPNASSPRAALARAPATWSRSHFSFVPEKYASRTRPVFAVQSSARGRPPRSASQTGAVRRSCQTIAFASGRPVDALPEDGRLALVRDADRGDVRRRKAPPSRAPRASRRTASPRSRSGRARPIPAPGRSAGTPSARSRRRGPRGRRRARASWSCPGRGRGRTASVRPILPQSRAGASAGQQRPRVVRGVVDDGGVGGDEAAGSRRRDGKRPASSVLRGGDRRRRRGLYLRHAERRESTSREPICRPIGGEEGDVRRDRDLRGVREDEVRAEGLVLADGRERLRRRPAKSRGRMRRAPGRRCRRPTQASMSRSPRRWPVTAR